jgi:hypothetical protein
MPSDARLAQVTAVFSALVTQYRSAVAATLEDLRGSLIAHGADGSGRTRQLAIELGPFAAGRIDAQRLGGLLGEQAPLAPAALERLERAAGTLRDIASQGDDFMHLRVAAGGNLTNAVRARLAAIGGAFGAARLAAARNTMEPITAREDNHLAALPFGEWTAAERRLAPPLVVSVNGADCRPAGLAEFLDGMQKIVLLVDGDCAPAPLVRLISPAVFVAQSNDTSICNRIVNWPGAAIVAIVPDACARFVHDPAAGPELWQRVKVHHVPADAQARVGGLSAIQQLDELHQLEALAHQPALLAGATVAVTAVDPIDRLAAWLLRQADLTEKAGGD